MFSFFFFLPSQICKQWPRENSSSVSRVWKDCCCGCGMEVCRALYAIYGLLSINITDCRHLPIVCLLRGNEERCYFQITAFFFFSWCVFLCFLFCFSLACLPKQQHMRWVMCVGCCIIFFNHEWHQNCCLGYKTALGTLSYRKEDESCDFWRNSTQFNHFPVVEAMCSSDAWYHHN